MPVYTYKCSKCGYENDYIMTMKESIEEKSIPICIYCNIKMDKLIGIPMLKFSGGGWSKDGYVKKPQTEKKDG